MKRRNAESGKMRRPVKRTKITEGMYGNSMLYLKFVLLWAAVVTSDYMLGFRFEFLWPFWMMLRSVYDSFKYQGLAFSIFFICIALTSDLICFFFIPGQWIFFAASTYVWVQYVWYTGEKGVFLPTVVLCCVLVYVEATVRGVRGPERGGGLGGGSLDLCRPFAAHCVGYPVVTLGFGVKSYVGHRIRLRRQREVQGENEFYYQLLRQALPESAADQSQSSPKETEKSIAIANGIVEKAETEQKHMNGNAVHATSKSKKSEAKDKKVEANGTCTHDEHSVVQISTKAERHMSNHNHSSKDKDVSKMNSHSAHNHSNVMSNGVASGVSDTAVEREEDDRRHRPTETAEHPPQEKTKGSTKLSKCEKREKEAGSQKEERRKNRNKEKDRDLSEAHKGCEQSKEQNVKDKEVLNIKEKETISNKEKERDRERDREQREARECTEELRRTKAELIASRASETETRRSLSAAAAAERARRTEITQLRQANDELQQKLTSWRSTERAALERRLGEERRARTNAEQQLQHAQRQSQQRKCGECDGEWCRARRAAHEAEASGLRRELQRARDRAQQLQRDLSAASAQMQSLEARCEDSSSSRLTSALQLLQERASHLERSLSAETRIKLDLFSALGEAKRQLQIQEGVIATQEKELDELKGRIAQMLAVMPTDSFVGPAGSGVSKLRLSTRRSPDASPLDPNACVYTPKQLPCSDV